MTATSTAYPVRSTVSCSTACGLVMAAAFNTYKVGVVDTVLVAGGTESHLTQCKENSAKIVATVVGRDMKNSRLSTYISLYFANDT